LGKYSAAISDYEKCLKHRPDTFEAWKYRGNSRFAIGDIEGAMNDFQAAIGLEPDCDDCAVLNNCGVAFLCTGDFDIALNYFEKAKNTKEADRISLRENIYLAEFIKEKRQVSKVLNPQFVVDPVFEKDLEKKMKEVAQVHLLAIQSNNNSKSSNEKDKSFKRKVLEKIKGVNK